MDGAKKRGPRPISIRMVRTRGDLERAFRLREEIFIRGQRVPRGIEMDGRDGEAKHFLAYYRGRLAGCARIRFMGKRAKLERIAVLGRYRRRGLGKEITARLVSYARRMGAKEALMHAQCHAGDFYEKCGFKPRGGTFMEAGIRHRKMIMKL
jgi:predicted GNAT family N-acyltransferase